MDYIFEFNDNQTMSELKTEIERQIGKYIIKSGIDIDVKIERLEIPLKTSVGLAITIDIHPEGYVDRQGRSYYSPSDAETAFRLNLHFYGNQNNDKIVSRLVN